MKQWIIPALILVFGVINMMALYWTGPKLDPKPVAPLAPLVRVMTVTPEQVQMTSATHGTIAPRTESQLTPEVSGRVVSLSEAMVAGGFFEAGEVLFSIDTLDYRVALEQARAALARSESELDNAQKANARQQDLLKQQLTSDSLADDAQNRLRVAEASLREAKARLEKAERDLERTQIVAPYDGRVRSERVDVGQFVNRGTAVATIFATDYVEVRLPIKDKELQFVDVPVGTNVESMGAGVKLQASFGGEQVEWQGQVVRTEGEIDPQTRMVNVVARVLDPYETSGEKPPLSVGLFVSAEIEGGQFDDVVVLPRIALRNNSQVYVVDAENRLRFRTVEVLREVNDQVYIKAGLEAGERVCISPLDTAVDAMPVRVPNPTNEVARR
jgi:RND family efflux transporter MFP subunit